MAGESGEPGKAALVDALLRIPVMQEPDGRALVLAELAERGYRLDAMRYSRDRHDIWAIISACLQQPAALAELAEVLHGIEGDHFAAAEFRRLVQAHLAGTAHPAAAPAPPQPPYSQPPRRPGPADSPDSGPDLLIRATAPAFAEPAGVFPHVAHDQLTRGAQLGAGARGRVFALLGHPGLVYKEYLSSHVNGGALTELILQRAMMGADERKQLDTSTSWPLMRVMAGRQVVGSLMRALPDDFYVAADDSRRPAYLSYLCLPAAAGLEQHFDAQPGRAAGDCPRPSRPGRIPAVPLAGDRRHLGAEPVVDLHPGAACLPAGLRRDTAGR